MARPAAGAGRQAQIARLLLSAVVVVGGGCAQTGDPPGGPPRTTPAAILRTVPESGAVVPDLHGAAVIQFDEVIDEAPGGSSVGGAITGLAQKIVLSPVNGDVKVSWHRDAIHVSPAEGWKRNRVYHLEVLPGIADLRRNITKKGHTIVFSTDSAVPAAALSGTAVAWVEQRILPQAVIRAALLPDTVAYVTLTDSTGDFRLANIPPGRYRVWAIQDQNNNRRQDRREAFDTVTVTVDSTASTLLWVFVHDTVGPRLKGVDPLDSVTFRVNFTQSLDPVRPPDTSSLHLFALPDTTPVPVRTLFRPTQYDSIQARARAVADSLKRLQDSLKRLQDTTHRDTSRARPGAPPPPSPQRPPPAQARGGRPGGGADTTAKVDTARVRKLLAQRPVPYDRVVVRVATPLTPGAKYLVRVHSTNLNGASASAAGVLVVPVPKPPADTTKKKAPKPPPP
ncbi:MAG TPA: Ig-like domain-containing protein [Gemmatimonadales bacterium]|nr:Ig-like domain-containing protein [Gemmatimonadales bacterium]